MLCFFLRRERDNLGEVLRGEKDDTPRIVESNMGKECQRTNSKERAVLFFIVRRTLRFFYNVSEGKRRTGKRIMFLT